ncbi:MAG TPA: gliding motility-associated C-terminal domain-containing protein [Bacteroidales bacterium]|nr:gliding motility-associated C-terminal domain-containing protein [Bacteroidales bacterium]
MNVTDGAQACQKRWYSKVEGLIIYQINRLLKRIVIYVSIILSVNLQAQTDHNPYVNNPSINPSPLDNLENGGGGLCSFTVGNSGELQMADFSVGIEIRLRNGRPSGNDPISSLSGTALTLFLWSYDQNSRVFTGTQVDTIPALFSGLITVEYSVTENSNESDPHNGFSVQILPGIYQNDPVDDEIQLYTYTRCTSPGAPLIGAITQPDCDSPGGSVILNGLPATTWTIIEYPGHRSYAGSGSSFSVPNLDPGTYNFTVTNNENCTSGESADVVINPPSGISAPVIGTITQPSCTINTGSVSLGGLPQPGTWTLIIVPGDDQEGTGTNHIVTNLSAGLTYRFAVRSADGCLSPESQPVNINQSPQIPSAPIIRTITQPTCESATGSVELTGLPSQGTWTLTRFPGNLSATGTGSSVVVRNLMSETYTFTVTNPAGCTSASSQGVTISRQPNTPATPILSNVVQPSCSVATGSVVVSNLPSTGTWTLIRLPDNISVQGTGSTLQVSGMPGGNYNFRVSNSDGCTSSLSTQLGINEPPSAPSEPIERIDCFLGTSLAIITVTSPRGTGYQYRLDDGAYTGNPVFTSIRNGNHTITVRNESGCTTTGNEFSVSCGCVNGPSIILSSYNGSVCGAVPITVNGNTFGNATFVTVTENGAGTISSSTIDSSPFSFTYIPSQEDIGNVVRITFTSDNPSGEPCAPAVTTYSLSVNQAPAAPLAGNIVHPTCTTSTGSVVLNGLPQQVNWTLVRNPGQVSNSGTGTSATISGLEGGTYTFYVSVQGCTSPGSAQVIINNQPSVPQSPVVGSIVQPGCNTPTGSINLSGLPSSGTWTLIQYPGSTLTNGSGSFITLGNLNSGTYNFAVRNQSGCTSALSANVVIDQQPQTPAAPVAGIITEPSCIRPTGSVGLSGLPNNGNWNISSVPAGFSVSGRGTSTTINGLAPGSYLFNVTNSAGCTSPYTVNIVIPQIPGAPLLVINNPAPVCFPSTVDLTNTSITAGSSPMLTFSYWLNSEATLSLSNPDRVISGTYYIKAVNSAQCSNINPVSVVVAQKPVADAGPDQILDFEFKTETTANTPMKEETGHWTIVSGSGNFSNPSLPKSTISNLGMGLNVFLWTVSNSVCPESSDTLKIIVNDLQVPTLITPNEDGRNDYFLLKGIDELQGNELFIFDRRGILVYMTRNYSNNWNGVDQSGEPLSDDTYFFIVRSGNGRQKSGYVVIRR